MKKSIKIILAGLLAVPLLSFGALFVPTGSSVMAADPEPVCEDGDSIKEGLACTKPDDGDGPACLFGKDANDKPCVFTGITNAALYIIGAISVLMLIYGGIMYTISAGDSEKVKKAKNTILYAVVGIVVALLAYAIVNYVIGTLTK